MLLPKQSPPVERKASIERQEGPKTVEPQVICECRTNTNGTRTLWCLVGKVFYNTGKPC